MSDTVVIRTLEDLYRFIDERGIFEIAQRGESKRFKSFIKVAIEQLPKEETASQAADRVLEQLNEVGKILSKNTGIAEKSLKVLNTVSKLQAFSLVLNGLNLCATCAGFAIMYDKLDKMSEQIAEIVTVIKKDRSLQNDYEFKKIMSDHADMLDCRKKQSFYSEEKMRELVAGEYNVLDLLIKSLESDMESDTKTVLYTILNLAQMLSVSMKYFDEIYYFNNREAIGDGDPWHMSHAEWISIYDRLSSPEFIEKIQDFGFFEMGLNTVENDQFYLDFIWQIKGLKQDIEDNQSLIKAIDEPELFNEYNTMTLLDIQTQIEQALSEAGGSLDGYQDAMRVAVAMV